MSLHDDGSSFSLSRSIVRLQLLTGLINHAVQVNYNRKHAEIQYTLGYAPVMCYLWGFGLCCVMLALGSQRCMAMTRQAWKNWQYRILCSDGKRVNFLRKNKEEICSDLIDILSFPLSYIWNSLPCCLSLDLTDSLSDFLSSLVSYLLLLSLYLFHWFQLLSITISCFSSPFVALTHVCVF